MEEHNFLILPAEEQCLTSSEALKLKARVRDVAPKVERISGIWIYYTHVGSHIEHTHGVSTNSKVDELLGERGPSLRATNTSDGKLEAQIYKTVNAQPLLSKIYYITPRNISPWSSKATSISHVCGLKEVSGLFC